MLKVDQLKVRGLPPWSFEVLEGECLAVEGPSGSGKTLLLRAIADLDAADGRVYLNGAERAGMTAQLWRRRVRFVAAEPRWWAPTAAAHLADLLAAQKLLAPLGLDAGALDRPVEVLSTGERQRLALVRALCDEPKAILLDEPTGSLDPVSAGLVEELIRFLLLSGRNIILVSHDPRQIERLAHARLQLAQSVAASTEGRAS